MLPVPGIVFPASNAGASEAGGASGAWPFGFRPPPLPRGGRRRPSPVLSQVTNAWGEHGDRIKEVAAEACQTMAKLRKTLQEETESTPNLVDRFSATYKWAEYVHAPGVAPRSPGHCWSQRWSSLNWNPCTRAVVKEPGFFFVKDRP